MRTVEHGPMTGHRSPEGVRTTCRCGESFTASSFTAARGLLDAHLAEQVRRGSVRVILAHVTGADGVKRPVAVGPQYSTEQVLRERRQLELAGAECEVVSLQSLAQFLRATQPAEPPEPCEECETTGQNCRQHDDRRPWMRATQPAERAEAGR